LSIESQIVNRQSIDNPQSSMIVNPKSSILNRQSKSAIANRQFQIVNLQSSVVSP